MVLLQVDDMQCELSKTQHAGNGKASVCSSFIYPVIIIWYKFLEGSPTTVHLFVLSFLVPSHVPGVS